MEAVIISIGHEILVGHTVNTNATEIARNLLSTGIKVKKVITIEDDSTEIYETICMALKEVPLVISTGGLGPTRDDITKSAVARVFKTNLVKDEKLSIAIKAKYRSLGYKRIPKGGMTQALVPVGATVFHNPVGSAPCLLLRKNGSMLFLLPGVPEEAKALMNQNVLPFLENHLTGTQVLVRSIRTSGIGETGLAELIEPVIGRIRNPALSYLPGLEGVKLMLTGTGKNRSEITKKIQKVYEKIIPRIKKWVYSENEEDIMEIISRILIENKLTIAVAESCTGGLLSSRFTDISGSSQYFERGIVTYSNDSKMELLGVPEKMLAKYGAVSDQVAKAMAKGIRKLARTTIGLSTTGILGPTGATREKPVGLVYVGYSSPKKTTAVKLNFHHDRFKNKIRTVQMALMHLFKQLS